MTLISLVCLLALSSSVFGRSVPFNGYGGGYDSSATRMNILTGSRHELPLNDMSSTVLTRETFPTSIPNAYGSSLVPQPLIRTLPVSNYGEMNRALELDPTPLPPPIQTLPPVQPLPVPVVEPLPLTQADILCRGHRAEDVIPIDNNRRFVVCLDESKGVEQECPKGLYYHEGSRRCERKLGPADNLCASQPCFNGGQCIPTDSWYQCQCAAGFEGPTCELDARICQTQQPCGSGPDTRCQSFRLGAALQYICLFQDETAYGLNSQQIISGPCHGFDGPHALSFTDKGFIMCDGERMFIESCPGGTVWDNFNKACVWPDMQIDVTTIGERRSLFEDRSGYGSGYGQTRTLPAPTYGGYGGEKTIIRPRVMDTGYGSQTFVAPKAIESGYGGGYGGEKVLIRPKVIESGYGGGYGGEKVLIRPKVIESGYGGGYGGDKVLIRPKVMESGYGSQTFVAPKALDSGYGGQTFVAPKVLDSGYGGQTFVAPKVLNSGYGGQSFVAQKSLDSGYGGQTFVAPKVLDSGYGGETTFTAPKVLDSGYGGERTFITPKVIESGYGGERTFIRPKAIDSGYGGHQEEMVSVKKIGGGY
jgi:hypothetical protein